MANYILASNKKAIDHFNNLGIGLSKVLTQIRGYRKSFDGNVYYNTNKIILVNSTLSSKAFHKYLKHNGLLLRQQAQH